MANFENMVLVHRLHLFEDKIVLQAPWIFLESYFRCKNAEMAALCQLHKSWIAVALISFKLMTEGLLFQIFYCQFLFFSFLCQYHYELLASTLTSLHK